MASKAYLEWIGREVIRSEPVPLTRWQKVKNWWYYHKWQILLCVVVLAVAGDLIWHALGIGVIKPDYHVAYVGRTALPEDAVTAVGQAISALGQDVNGDGTVTVSVVQYVEPQQDTEEAAGYRASAEVRLMADLETWESSFFLLEDPEAFQRMYGVLASGDGTYAEQKDYTVYRWSDCPALAAEQAESEAPLLAGLYLGRRGEDERQAQPEEDRLLWEACIEEAVP